MQKFLKVIFGNLACAVSSNGKAAKAADGDALLLIEVFNDELTAFAPHDASRVLFMQLVTAAGRHGRFAAAQSFQHCFVDPSMFDVTTIQQQWPWVGVVVKHGRFDVQHPRDPSRVPAHLRHDV